MSVSFRKYIELFNRKERYYVVKEATGNFALSSAFLDKLMKDFPELGMPPCKDVYIAMDYHFDWLYASLFLANNSEMLCYERDPDLITGNQEDIDLILTYSDKSNPEKSHLIMIEAKCDTSWTNKQADSKARRLDLIFGRDGKRWPMVIPHYLIWSPKLTQLSTSNFPAWAINDKNEFYHLSLELPKTLLKVTCCDQNGNNCSVQNNATHWKVETRHKQ